MCSSSRRASLGGGAMRFDSRTTRKLVRVCVDTKERNRRTSTNRRMGFFYPGYLLAEEGREQGAGPFKKGRGVGLVCVLFITPCLYNGEGHECFPGV